MDIPHRWTRKAYSGRGKLRGRDRELERIRAGACVICHKTLERKTGKISGRLESFARFEERKTCGLILVQGALAKSECLKKYLEGENNPNFKGIMPRCIECGVKIAYYTEKEKPSKKAIRCRKCFIVWWPTHKTQKQIAMLQQRAFKKGMKPTSGAFKKGCKPTNKKFDFCTIAECGKKHLAKGFCRSHYYKNVRNIKKLI